MVMCEFSLADKSKLTGLTLDKVKLLAYLVYNALVDYEEESGNKILYKNNIIPNELYDDYRNHVDQYEFEHTDYVKGIYEPFMINDTSFGFTIYNNSITMVELKNIIVEQQLNINFNVNFNINCIVLRNNRDRLEIISDFYPNSKPRGKIRRLKHA